MPRLGDANGKAMTWLLIGYPYDSMVMIHRIRAAATSEAMTRHAN